MARKIKVREASPARVNQVNLHTGRYRTHAPAVRGGRSNQRRLAINDQMGARR